MKKLRPPKMKAGAKGRKAAWIRQTSPEIASPAGRRSVGGVFDGVASLLGSVLDGIGRFVSRILHSVSGAFCSVFHISVTASHKKAGASDRKQQGDEFECVFHMFHFLRLRLLSGRGMGVPAIVPSSYYGRRTVSP